MSVIQERRTIAEPNIGVVVLGYGRRIATHYLVHRLLRAFFTIFLVVSLSFFMFRLMPGSPVEVYIANLQNQYSMTFEEAKQQAASLFSLDLDAPVYAQYFDYLGNLAQGDLGTSLVSRGVPVSTLILRYLPWTLFSVGIGLVISFTLGVLLGMLMAYRRDSLLDHALTTFASVTSSIPNYLLAIILIVYLGVQWELVSIAAMRGSLSPGVKPGLNLTFIRDAFYHAALPILAYVLTTIGGWMLTMRSSTEATLGEDYVTVAKARGLPERRIATAYVGRNASLPLFTQLTIAVAFVVGGSFILEFIFVYQGLGLVLLNAINQRDYPVMQGVFLVLTSMVVLVNLFADLVYARLDPRIRLGGGR
ncbi:MAG TPA: ABC transporter permease [Herpetosiphonaceae bacterium]|nr:ABC transporter permease [Herpetosiphonaceae bacterium]